MGGLGGDNMTIIIICFLHGKPWENLVEKCKKYHSEKKSLSKLHEPAFNTFDRFTAEGPFSEVSVLKSDDSQNSNETSSSHTSSPSSSPISTEDKFEGILTDTLEAKAKENDIQLADEDENHPEPCGKDVEELNSSQKESADRNDGDCKNDVKAETVKESLPLSGSDVVSNGKTN